MRISDWSSDVCSSDLISCVVSSEWRGYSRECDCGRCGVGSVMFPVDFGPYVPIDISAKYLTSTYERLKDDQGWIVKSLPIGHDVFGQAPNEFLAFVQELKSVTAARTRSEEHTSELQSLMRN